MFQSTRVALFVLATLLVGCNSSYMASSWSDPGEGAGQSPTGWSNYNPAEEDLAVTSPDPSPSDENSATGICYVKTPAIPSAVRTMQVLKRPERRAPSGSVVIPAQYVTVEVPDAEFEGFAWKPAVCEESLDRHLMTRIQEALMSHGYDVGAIDGIPGPATTAGLEYFKRDNGFFGEGMTHEVLQALGIDPSTGGTAFAGI